MAGHTVLLADADLNEDGGVTVDLPGAKVVEEFFPPEILASLVDEIESSSIRKREFRLWSSEAEIPQSVVEAARFTTGRTGIEFNFAILKWYRITDDYSSLAYIVHQDPVELRSIPLVLCTLRGEADLTYWDSEHCERVIRCQGNMMVLLDADLEHQVSPPLGPEGERLLLFLGFDTNAAGKLPMIAHAVVLDLDGVIIESEEFWERARQRFAKLEGKVWTREMNVGIIGMGPKPSSEFIRLQLGLTSSLDQIQDGVVDQLLSLYEDALPASPGAFEAVRMLASRWPLGLASSASRRVMDRVLSLSGLAPYFGATVSSEEVTRGKPFADVYLKACATLEVDPRHAVAIEDSNSGIESALAAGMRVIAVTGSAYPPSEMNRQRASSCVDYLAQVSIAMVEEVLSNMA